TLGRLAVLASLAGVLLGSWVYVAWVRGTAGPPQPEHAPLSKAWPKSRYTSFNRFGFWIGEGSPGAPSRAFDTGDYSNSEPEDYTPRGAASCAECHPQQHQGWSRHPHRWMNAAATPDRVAGDFSGRSGIRYLGGEGRFWRDGDTFRMAVERGPLRREFRITRTIGSRYFEYYVGVQTAGPEPPDDERYRTDHVLPFGYWLTRRQWVPTVHIREDRADDQDDPRLNPYEDFYFRSYDAICARCHTTLPVGDWLI